MTAMALPERLASSHVRQADMEREGWFDYFDTSRAEHLLDRPRSWSDATIARWTHLAPIQIRALRFIRVGAMPNASHKELVWLLARYADHYGFHGHQETSLRTAGRERIIPDLIVCKGDHVRWIVEVKSRLWSDREVEAAVEQVSRYREVIGEGQPVVTAYRVPPIDAVNGVLIRSASRLRAEMKAAS